MQEDTKQEIESLKEEIRALKEQVETLSKPDNDIKFLKEELKFHSHDGRGTKMINDVLRMLPYIEGKFKTQGSVGLTTTYLDADGKTITVTNGIIT